MGRNDRALVTQETRKQYRAIGASLAIFVREHGNNCDSSVLTGVVADLVGDQTELLLPLKDLVSRPGFRALATKAGSGSGQLESDALLHQVKTIFSEKILEGLEELLGGFLDLPAGKNAEKLWPNQKDENPRSSSHKASSKTSNEYKSSAAPVAKPKDSTQQKEPEIINNSARHKAPLLQLSGWQALAMGVMAAGALTSMSLVTLRTPALCKPLGLCMLGNDLQETEAALGSAIKAEQELREATTLDQYRQGVENLKNEIKKINMSLLNENQVTKAEKLRNTADKAENNLIEEQKDIDKLERAETALEQARGLTGIEAAQQLQLARSELNSIPSSSFSAAKAGRLVEELKGMEAATSPTPDAGGQSATTTAEELPSTPPSPRVQPQRSATSAPRPRQQAPDNSAPWRDEPLF